MPFLLLDDQVGEVRWTALRCRPVSAPVGSQIPDGLLLGLELDSSDGIVGSVGYTRNSSPPAGVADMTGAFAPALHDTISRHTAAIA
ncbi:hypothetical protein O7608_09375 [Solwaraspora sp. WMMA2056]|uniref:hypothetical protein n=1 Tax=Solwaraspora sp. WMMA2056 TaxID=3015161 RepID=UPI00259B6666|nr:hypothetical protein [Solwaraspora sp. WMMA2056]WJK44233.1 hypothetical protein O7608_09375 [Solwaraspora sp. WMMA2056]